MDTKALRQKILDLAIRGKLIPQNPNDEPASVLLDRIRAEKQQMVKDGKLKAKDLKNDTIIFVGDDNLHYEKFSDGTVEFVREEIPFAIPKNWNWVRLENICYNIYAGGDKPSDFVKEKDAEHSIPVVANGTTNEGIMGFTKTSTAKANTITIAGRGTIGFPVYRNYEYCPVVRLIVINQCDLINPHFLYYYLYARRLDSVGSSIPQLTVPMVKPKLIPLPPLEEQERISLKLDLLFNIINNVNTTKDQIKTDIEKIKSKILDLAIRGKLVEQDLNEEPASVLLERIRREKEELIKSGKLKRDKRESVIFRGEDNSYYLRTGKLVEPLTDWSFDDLPKNWEICCFGEICNYGDCINVESSLIENGAWILDLEDIEKDTGRILSRISKEDRQSISTKHKFNKGQVLYSKLRPYLNKVVLADQDGYCTSEILPLEFHSIITPEYARYYLMSPTFLRYADKCSYGVKMPRLGTNDGKKAIFPLPPINEQRRIVKQIEFMFSHLSDIETRVQ